MFLIGEKYRHRLEDSLKKLNLEVFWLPDNPNVDKRLSGHADLMVYAVRKTVVLPSWLVKVTANYLSKNTSAPDITLMQNYQNKIYPHDCGLCIRSTGLYDIYNPKTIDNAVIPLLNGRPIHVNQGYTACTVCAINGNSIITSDAGIACITRDYMNVLQIHPGFIELPGFSYGFIGGASFLIDRHTMAFTGSINHHPDNDRILAFLKRNAVQPVFLTDDTIFDIGGAIQLP